MAATMIGDVDDTIECSNCGHANPSWAQVCRNCGVSLRRDLARPVKRPVTPFPTDQSSLLSLGAAVGSIVIAIVLGLFLSAVNPTQPTVGLSTSPSPTPRATATATATAAATPTPATTPTPKPKPIGTITFGTGLDQSTHRVINPTNSFGPNGYFAHSVSMPQPFGVSNMVEEVVRVANGKETVVQSRSSESSQVPVDPSARVFGFIVTTNSLLQDWGAGGTFIMRVYRGNEKIAEGQFVLRSS